MSQLSVAQQLLDTLQSGGYRAYLVGGCVRDMLLERPVEDIDICTSARPEEVMTLFRKTVPTGLKHGTVTVLAEGHAFEVTTFRTESGYTDHRRPDRVQFVESLYADLSRRDLTINAIAMDQYGKLYDYFGGLRDMQLRLIRPVGQAEARLTEDALRMLRAVRFTSQLGFVIEREMMTAIGKHRHLLQTVAAERLTEEFHRLLSGPYINLGLKMFGESGLIRVTPFHLLLPGLELAAQLDLSPLTVLERWVVLLLPLHVADRRLFFQNLRLSNAFIKPLKRLLDLADKRADWYRVEQLSPLALLDWTPTELLSLLKINRLMQGKVIDPELETKLNRFINRLPLRHPNELVVDGHDLQRMLGRPPGPWIGAALHQLREAVQTGEVANDREAIRMYLLEREQDE